MSALDKTKARLWDQFRDLLLYYFGTTDPDLLAELWRDRVIDAERPSLDRLQGQLLAWQAATFPERTCQSIAAHLRREARELVGTDEEPAISFQPWEMADVFMLLIALADECGTDLAQAVHEKLEMNRSRTWGKPDSQGVVEHIK